MGDPAGVGPEIILKALLHPEVHRLCRPVVYGDVGWMRHVARDLSLPMRIKEYGPATEDRTVQGEYDADRFGYEHVTTTVDLTIGVRQCTDADLSGVRYGELSAEAGRAAAQAVIAAAQDVMAGEADAVVTAPLNKEAIALGGYPYPGHTELLAEVTHTPKYGMLLLSGPLRVVHVSTHVSLREAIARVKTARVLECIRLGNRACRDLGLQTPHIAVAGLNPHAGEHGMFGSEEAEEIAPAIERALSEGIRVSGPHPPDTVFARAMAGEFDLVVAMYHDQGHIPVKLHGFDTGVNVTIGLPIIRVSVDHGTAFDIAGRGIARENSLLEALRVAALLATARRREMPAD
jgi:4-hydroxythreonine-4-phosphate dehydrogenase